MPETRADVLIVGSGLGATAAAAHLASSGRSVVILTGVGCSRSPHLDGGIVDPERVAAAFGPGAPLGEPVVGLQSLQSVSRRSFDAGPVEGVASRRRYRRSVLESWGMERAVAAGAVYLDDFVESKALPRADGSMSLTSERDDRIVHADVIVLCEGADPRIPLRVKLRPDYGPEDQLHFARTMMHGASVDVLRQGSWRTSWGMPVAFQLIPQQDGLIVSVVARIENVMRSNRSSADALSDLLGSPAFAQLRTEGQGGDIGTELVALRRDPRGAKFVHDRLLMGIDAAGVIDSRDPARADLTIRSGQRLASFLVAGPTSLDGWEENVRDFVRDAIRRPESYHDDRGTGYLEDGPAKARGALSARMGGLIRRGAKTQRGKGA